MTKIVRRTITPKPPKPVKVDRTAEFQTYASFSDALAAMGRKPEACAMVSLGIRGLAVVGLSEVGELDVLYAKAKGWHRPVPLTPYAKSMYAHALKYTASLQKEDAANGQPATKKLKKRPLTKPKR